MASKRSAKNHDREIVAVKPVKQTFDEEFLHKQRMIHRHIKRIADNNGRSMKEPMYRDTYENIWEITMQIYALGMDNMLRHIRKLKKESSTDGRPPMTDSLYDYVDLLDQEVVESEQGKDEHDTSEQ